MKMLPRLISFRHVPEEKREEQGADVGASTSASS